MGYNLFTRVEGPGSKVINSAFPMLKPLVLQTSTRGGIRTSVLVQYSATRQLWRCVSLGTSVGGRGLHECRHFRCSYVLQEAPPFEKMQQHDP